MIPVPTIALATPPPLCPAGTGLLMKKFAIERRRALGDEVADDEHQGEDGGKRQRGDQPGHETAHQAAAHAARVHRARLPTAVPRATRQISRRAAAFTSDRDDEQDEADFEQRREIETGGRLAELVRDGGGHGVGGLQHRDADVVAVADQHGDGHRFAQRAAEAQNDGAHEAGAAVGHDGGPHRFPAGGAHAERGLALRGRDGQQHLARHGGDVGHDHDREDDGAGEQRVAVEHAAEERRPPEHGAQRRDDVSAQERNQHEDAPQAVHHARDRRQQLDEKRRPAAAATWGRTPSGRSRRRAPAAPRSPGRAATRPGCRRSSARRRIRPRPDPRRRSTGTASRTAGSTATSSRSAGRAG